MTTAVIIVVLVLGLVLIFTEVAVIPGFGVAGALGLLALAAGAIAAWTELGPIWGGALFQHVSEGAPFWTGGGLVLVTALFALRLHPGESRRPHEVAPCVSPRKLRGRRS